MLNRIFLFFLGTTLLLSGAVLSSCSSKPKEEPQENIRDEMRSVYKTTARLFSYVWLPNEFRNPQNEKTILSLLDDLAKRFHKVEAITPLPGFEPGFRVTLCIHQEALSDIRDRFAAGQKDYANTRLRGLIHNCVSCHSRYEIPIDFVGDNPPIGGQSFEDQLARAEFLLATRQIDRASEDLLALAAASSMSPAGTDDFREAMKLWLVIAVRTQKNWKAAGTALADRTKTFQLSEYNRRLIDTWATELEALGPLPDGPITQLREASKLLRPLHGGTTLEDDEMRLVQTLRATSILHATLQRTTLAPSQKKLATYLLAIAYQHLPVASLSFYGPLYLEQCIREFPYTAEAERCYIRLHEVVESENTGSSGLHLDERTSALLKELRGLAFGDSQMIVPDTFRGQ